MPGHSNHYLLFSKRKRDMMIPVGNPKSDSFYRLTRSGRKLLETETRDWEQTAAIIARFFEVKAEDLT
jgi:DNA-binding PadR family transcriptional regulator